MNLRIKILSGFLILALMLFIAGIWSIYELNSIGSSVQKILDDNYQSIYLAKSMKESLEREDSATLLLLLGKWDEGRAIMSSADSSFNHNFKMACKNITIPGEKSQLDSIQFKYSEYKELWKRPIVGTEKQGNLNWYFKKIHKSFLSVKNEIDNLIKLNDKIMYQTSSDLEQRANRAIMPGIIAIIASLVFTLLFNYLVNYYMVSPIIKITQKIQKFMINKTPFDFEVETHDEIYELANSIRNLCAIAGAKDERK